MRCSKERDCQISLPGFWLYLLYALLYRQLFELSQCVYWNLVLQKECIEFYLNSFSNHFHCTILSLFLGLSLHIIFLWAPTEYRFLNVVTMYGLIQPLSLGYCSNHVLLDIRFLNMKFGWTKYNGNVMAHLPFKLCVPIRIIV